MKGGLWLSIWGGALSFGYKKMCDNGLFLTKGSATDPETTKNHDWDTGMYLGNAFHWKWSGSKIFDKWENKPAWKRWEEKEEAEEGK